MKRSHSYAAQTVQLPTDSPALTSQVEVTRQSQGDGVLIKKFKTLQHSR